ncbi:MAG: HPr(Ser) kinase/phosphatase [Oscillospiraceae bacterium]|nr:HPr(Ser) kinase/phosphatase [Oscillospiraceae bacterium]
MNTNGVLLKNVVSDFRLQIAYASSDYDQVVVCVEEVTRPGLPLAGFFDHFESQRLQVIGNVEYTYIQNQTHERLLEVFGKICEAKIPAIIFARSMEPTPECLEMAKKHDITVLRCMEATSYMVSSLITYLKNALAPHMTRHGVLVEVYGEGLLLMGESGIGKSETAAELLKRGHRLIADDAVRIRKIANNTLMGDAPDLIQNYIEIRGIGVINVAKLYGMASVKKETAIDLVINIVPWSDEQDFDRLGLEDQYVDLLGVKIPSITCPVKPGRNLSIILEIAAMNNRQKKMGYNSAKEFTERINRHFIENSGQSF